MNKFNYKETFFIQEKCTQEKELIEDFNRLMWFYFDGVSFKDETDSGYTESEFDLRGACADLYNSKIHKGANFFDEFSREEDLRRLRLDHKTKKYKKFLLDYGVYAKEYYLKKFLEKGLISEKYFSYLDILPDNWDSLKEIFYVLNREKSAEKVILKTPEEIKEKIKKIIGTILEEDPKKSYRLLNNLYLVIEKINNLLGGVNQLGTGFELKAENLLPKLMPNGYINYFNEIK